MISCEDEQLGKLRDFWESGKLEKLEGFTDKFNIFNALKLDNAEIRHSNFLAWLMNPCESHKLGDYFLKEFFKKALKNFNQNSNIKVKPQDIIDKSFFECEIRREDNNIDILIINPDIKFLCVIENKIWSGEHSQQLERYAEYVKKQFKGYQKLYIFLTPNPNPDEPVLKRGDVFYIQMGYEQILAAIEKTLKHRSSIMSDDIRIFIKHYKKMVERNIMNKIDKNVMDFCKGLYRNHRDSIDLINQCIENMNVEMMGIIKEVAKKQSTIKEINGSTIYFLPKEHTLKYGKDKNWLGGSIVGLYFGKSDNNEGFDFGISLQIAEDADNPQRNELIKALENEFGVFRNKGDTWRWLPLSTVMTIDKYCEFENSAEAKEHIELTIKDFIDKFNEVVN